MNSFLLCADNSIVHSVKSPVLEKTSNVEDIRFICEKTYNGMDMSTFDLVLTYKLPISHEIKIVTLELIDSDYKDDFLLYSLPVEAKNISSETGEVILSFNQLKSELDPDTGNLVKYVRTYQDAVLNILPISKYLSLSDEGLSQIAELYLANKAQIEALAAYANIIYSNKADDIALDEDKITLMSNGAAIGEGITLEDFNDRLVESGSLTNGNINIVHI